MNDESATTDKEVLLQAIEKWLQRQQQEKQQKQSTGDV